MALFRRPPSRVSLTSAAQRVINPETTRPTAIDAAGLYGLRAQLGQVRSALEFKSMAASKVEYYVAVQDDPGDSPEKTDDAQVVEAYDRLRGLTGGFPEFVGEFATHLDTAGEGYLVGFGEGDADSSLDKDDWDVVSPVEYNEARAGGYQRRDSSAIPKISDDDFVLRVWRPSPMRRQDPDSPLRGVQTECEQYILYRGMLTSLGRSRLIAPIVDMPDDWSFPPKANGDPSESLMDLVFEAADAAVNDVDSASRIVPIFVQRSASSQGQINVTWLAQDLPEWVPLLMEKILRQIATGLDLPADILLGLADVNHWNAWLSEDSAKLDYVDPLVLLILDSLTRGYLHPTLTEMGVSNPERYLFWRDYSDLIARSVGTEDAVALYDRHLISGDATRRVVGFTESDAPDENEIRPPAPLVEFPAGPGNVSRGAPPIPVLTAAGRKIGLGQIDHRLYAQISEAAQAALDRSLERAGAKIRQAANGKLSRGGGGERLPKFQTLASSIDGVPNHQVGLTVGPSVKATLQLTDDDLIPPGSFDALGRRVDKILEAGQDETYTTISELTDTTPERDEDQEATWREKAVGLLLAGLGALAIRKLFTPDLEPDPAETGEVEPTQIPSPLIFDTLTVAGGGEPGFNPEAPRGLANGEQTQKWLVQAKFQIREREWTIGSPALPFEPHRALRGTRFTEWTDPALSTPPTVGWLGVSYMFPGDHRGCQCVAELVVDDTEDLFPPIAASAGVK